MNYFITQEQYEQLKEMSNSIEFIEVLNAYDELMEQIGNQKSDENTQPIRRRCVRGDENSH